MQPGESFSLVILGRETTFRPGADAERIKEAVQLLEERYAALKARAQGTQAKESLLANLALGLADELLRMKSRQDEAEERLSRLLAKIEKSL